MNSRFKIPKPKLIKYAIVAITTVIFQVVMSEQVTNIIDSATNGKREKIHLSFIYAILSILLYQLFVVIKSKFSNIIIMNSIMKLKKTLFTSFFNSEPAKKSEYISIFCNDIALVEEKYFVSTLKIVESISMIVIISIALLNINFWIFVVIVIMVLINLIISVFTQQSMTSKVIELSESYDKEMEFMDNYFDGYITIKSLEAENVIIKKYNQLCEKLETQRYKYSYEISFLSSLFEGISFVDIIVITFVSAYFILDNTMSLGNLIAVTILANVFFASVPVLLMSLLEVNSTKVLWEKIFNSLQVKKEQLRIEKFNNMKITNLTVSFDDLVVINDFNIQFVKGHKLCLVGDNGTGKSTFINCLCSLQDYEGSIFYNDTIIQNVDIFKSVVYIPQKPFVFSDTVEFNIFLGKENRNQKEFENLLDIFALNDFYKVRKTSGMDFNEQTISGGEKQKIALVRALLKKPDILIMDEALSMVDIESRKSILEYLLVLDLTIIHVTHDKEMIDCYDIIVDFNNL